MSMNIKLNPMPKQSKKKLKQLCEKENGWVLDCVNEQKSKLKPYSAVKDKYLKYFVVRVPKKKKMYAKSIEQSRQEIIDGERFRDFLNEQKRKILQSRAEQERRSQTERNYNQSRILHQKDENQLNKWKRNQYQEQKSINRQKEQYKSKQTHQAQQNKTKLTNFGYKNNNFSQEEQSLRPQAFKYDDSECSEIKLDGSSSNSQSQQKSTSQIQFKNEEVKDQNVDYNENVNKTADKSQFVVDRKQSEDDFFEEDSKQKPNIKTSQKQQEQQNQNGLQQDQQQAEAQQADAANYQQQQIEGKELQQYEKALK